MAQDLERAFTRVRGAHPEIRRLIREVDRMSATFRTIVDELQRSNAIVVVQFGLCANGRFRSCVVGVEGDARHRHIRVVLKARPTDYRLMATLAHELQHALEIVREADVVDGESVLRLYRRIATGECKRGLSETCETETARAVEAKVLHELHGGGANDTARP